MGKGQLIFKGEKTSKKHKKRKRSREDEDGVVDASAAACDNDESNKAAKIGVFDSGDTSQLSTSKPAATAAAASAVMPSIRKGTGKITTSGTVVTGISTKFEKEVAVGDAIVVINDKGQEELRVITMRLSNASLNLSSAFSSCLKEPNEFSIIHKPRNEQKEKLDKLKKQQGQAQELEKNAFDLYKSTSTLVYREKTETGSYRIKKESIASKGGDGAPSRGDLLYMRSKKSSDKYC
jgi:hypothetical protein